jgi:hypothetical protein
MFEEKYRKLRLQALVVCSNDTFESMRGSIKNLRALIRQLDDEPEKRKPDDDGVLPLTSGELEELAGILAIQFGEKTLKDKIMKVCLGQFLDTINCEIQIAEDLTHKRNISNYKAIRWLDKLFELGEDC